MYDKIMNRIIQPLLQWKSIKDQNEPLRVQKLIENIETHVIEWLRNSNDSDMQVTGIPIIKTWFGLLLPPEIPSLTQNVKK